MKNVLVTGATGFLGRHLVKKLESIGYNVSISNSKIANLLDEKNLHIYNTHNFQYIFHLAAHTKAGDYCLYHKGEQFEINQLINTNILSYWRKFHPNAKMIAMGTSCSYAPNIEMSEQNYLIGEPDDGLYTYAMTKRMLLIGLKSYAEQYGLKYLYYIPSTLYGPDFELTDTHFIFDLIKKIYAGKNHNSLVELWGDGYQKRELVYINDAIQNIINTLHLENELINLGSGIEYSIREYASNICDIIGYDPEKITYNENKYVGVKSKKLIVEKIKNILLTQSYTSLNQGLLETIEYYKIHAK